MATVPESLARSTTPHYVLAQRKKFTDRAIAYIKASNPEGGGRVIEL